MPAEALNLNEHSDAKWLTKETLESVKWLPADLVLLEKISEKLYSIASSE